MRFIWLLSSAKFAFIFKFWSVFFSWNFSCRLAANIYRCNNTVHLKHNMNVFFQNLAILFYKYICFIYSNLFRVVGCFHQAKKWNHIFGKQIQGALKQNNQQLSIKVWILQNLCSLLASFIRQFLFTCPYKSNRYFCSRLARK